MLSGYRVDLIGLRGSDLIAIHVRRWATPAIWSNSAETSCFYRQAASRYCCGKKRDMDMQQFRSRQTPLVEHCADSMRTEACVGIWVYRFGLNNAAHRARQSMRVGWLYIWGYTCVLLWRIDETRIRRQKPISWAQRVPHPPVWIRALRRNIDFRYRANSCWEMGIMCKLKSIINAWDVIVRCVCVYNMRSQ